MGKVQIQAQQMQADTIQAQAQAQDTCTQCTHDIHMHVCVDCI